MPGKRSGNNKTQPHDGNVEEFLQRVEPAGRREDALVLLEMMREVTGEPARLWGESIVGFGQYHYVYASGREGDYLLTGFAARKANLVVYIMPGFSAYGHFLEQLGSPKIGRSCLYLGRLDRIDCSILRRLIEQSVQDMRRIYP